MHVTSETNDTILYQDDTTAAVANHNDNGKRCGPRTDDTMAEVAAVFDGSIRNDNNDDIDADHIFQFLLQYKRRISNVVCKGIVGDDMLQRFKQFCVDHHDSFHLHSLALPKNPLLTIAASEPLAFTVGTQLESLQELDLSDNLKVFQGPGLSHLVNVLTSTVTNGTQHRLKRLVLTRNGIGTKKDSLSALARLIRDNTSIEELYLAHNGLSSRSMNALAPAICHNTTLRTLDVSHNKLSDKGVGRLCAALDEEVTESNLTTLNLTKIDVGVQGANHICTLLISNRTITSLNLSMNPKIGSEGVHPFQLVLQYNHTLVELNLSSNNFEDDAVAIAHGLTFAQDSHLRRLDLSWNSLTSLAAIELAVALEGNSVLESLTLTSNAIGDEGVTALARALHANFALRELDIVGNQMKNPSGLVDLICHGSYRLKKLAYEHNRLSDEQEARIRNAFTFRENRRTWLGRVLRDIAQRKRLTLNPKSRDYGDEELVLIADQLGQHSSIVTTAFFSSSRITYRGMDALAKSVLCNSRAARIERLYLRGCKNLGERGFSLIATALSNSTCSLQCLTLANCNMDKQSALTIATALEHNSSLNSINLESNHIETVGAKAILSVIVDPPHPSIVSTNLSANNVGDAAMLALRPLLKLQYLYLDDNGISDIGALDLSKAVMHSSVVKCLSIKANKVTKKGVQTLLLFLRTEWILECDERLLV